MPAAKPNPAADRASFQGELASPRWLSIPHRADAWLGLRLSIVVDAWFALAYFGCNWLTAQRTVLHRFYIPEELALPLLPWAVWPYLSMVALLGLLFFCVPARRARPLARAFLIGITLSAAIWLAFPAQLGFTRKLPEQYGAVYAWIFALDYPHNLLPSLHIVFSTLAVLACTENATGLARWMLWAWLALIACSTLFTHQHHAADVLAGFAVALFSRRAAFGHLSLKKSATGAMT